MHASPLPYFLLLGSLSALTGVTAGAFGAHSLKSILDAQMLAVYETAVRYQMYHAFALFIAAWTGYQFPEANVRAAGWCFVGGTILFSGSLYLLALLGLRWLGAITPIGGFLFLAGWGLLGWTYWKSAWHTR
jgi:uncharacterized membrane protein YgdD (TMEM256/DUF423 family)